MVFVPIILFPLCLILSFWARKSRKAFITILTIACLTFCFMLELNLYSQECLLKHAWTASSIAGGFSFFFFIGYGLLWLFFPVKWIDRLMPIFLFFISFSMKNILALKWIVWLGIVYYLCFYYRYLLSSKKTFSKSKNQKKKKIKKS